MKYIAFLRGVNVGKQNRLKMSAVKHELRYDYPDLKTVLAAGNLIFNSEAKSKALEKHFEELLKHYFDIDVIVIVRSVEELEYLMKKVRFTEEKTYLTFIQNPLKTLDDCDVYYLMKRDYIVNVEQTYRNFKFNNNYFEKQLEAKATTRNLKTIKKIVKEVRDGK